MIPTGLFYLGGSKASFQDNVREYLPVALESAEEFPAACTFQGYNNLSLGLNFNIK
jgi:hypothetical protein